ncbi:hypothetical protein GCM10009818_00160 [Nakamurella flavida]
MLLQTVAPLVSCRIRVPVAAVLTVLVIAAVNAENVFVMDSDRTTALRRPATIRSEDLRRRRVGGIGSDAAEGESGTGNLSEGEVVENDRHHRRIASTGGAT